MRVCVCAGVRACLLWFWLLLHVCVGVHVIHLPGLHISVYPQLAQSYPLGGLVRWLTCPDGLSQCDPQAGLLRFAGQLSATRLLVQCCL